MNMTPSCGVVVTLSRLCRLLMTLMDMHPRPLRSRSASRWRSEDVESHTCFLRAEQGAGGRHSADTLQHADSKTCFLHQGSKLGQNGSGAKR